MNQCLRCYKQCGMTSLFCDECKSLLEPWVAPGRSVQNVRPTHNSADDIAERLTAPNPVVPSPPRLFHFSLHNLSVNRVEHALHQLNDAARRIAAVEPNDSPKLKNAHLFPMSSNSTPEMQHQHTLLPDHRLPVIEHRPDEEMGGAFPDLWLQGDSEEVAAAGWSNHSDPLLTRHFPASTESARIEEDDMRRAAEGMPTFSLPLPRRRMPSQLRTIIICLALVVLFGLTIDGVLATYVFLHKKPVPAGPTGTPTITLSVNNVTYGQKVTVYVRHFTPSSQVYVTRDMQIAIQLNASNATVGPGRSMIRVNTHGDADVSLYIETTWDPGYHTIEAEDVGLHYTASTSLHIDNAGPTSPPHLIVDNLTIDLGSELVGANSIRPLKMHNAGSGSIVWSASSDQSWLLLAPNQGTFSDSQTISVGGERAHLKPGDYKGTLTVSSNVAAAVTVQVIMNVRPLPANAGPILQVDPALLAFVATDGGTNPASQSLVVSNPGSKPMHWSLTNNAPPAQSQGAFLNSLGSTVNWLNIAQTTGTVAPGATTAVRVDVLSQSLLPGAYIDTLIFTADRGTINSPQGVNISLTVQPQCALQLNSNSLTFTAVQGQSNPNAQSISLSASATCQATTTWQATPSASWLTVTAGSGQLKGLVGATVGIGVDIAGLPIGTYNNVVTITAAQNTQAVQVQLVVQAPPPPGAPILSVSPLNFNFNVTQGQANPPGQVISITNTGGSTLHWRSSWQQRLSPFTAGVNGYPVGGILAPGQTEQTTVVTSIVGASVGITSFTGTFIGFDDVGNPAGGTPQTITVNVNVQAPCSLAPPSSSSLAFTALQGAGNPVPQALSFASTGNCAWPVSWNISGNLPSWLNLSSIGGVFNANGQSTALNVAPTIVGQSPGTYTALVTIVASDGAGQTLAGSPQSFTVSLTVQAPCALQLSASGLTFSTPMGQSPPAQNVGISESGACALPVTWSASSNSSWLVLAASSGTGNGAGFNINTAGLVPGTYMGTITLSASDGGGGPVQNSPQTLSVTLTVTGFTIGGTVNACANSACSTSGPLAGAMVTLTDSGGKTFTTTADTSGNYTFSNVILGTCTISASGNSGTMNYSRTASMTVSGNQTNVAVNAIPS